MMEDFDLWLRILKKYGKIYNLPDILVNYRIHENQEHSRTFEKAM